MVPKAAPQADLLGMSAPVSGHAAPSPSQDLLGVHAAQPTATPHPTPAASSASLDDFFSGGSRGAPAPTKSAEPDYSAMFGAAPAMAGGEMIDFGLDAADIPPEFADLYAQEQVCFCVCVSLQCPQVGE